MSEKRDLLLRRLQEQFLPLLAEAGFEQLALSEEAGRSQELRLSLPFGYMRRIRNRSVELLEIQLDKHGAAKFVLNFGVALPEGATLPWKHVEQSEVRVSDLPEWYRLHSNCGGLRWFSFPWITLNGDLEFQATRVVDRACALYPEVEAWFETRTVGPHMRRVGYPLRGMLRSAR